MEFLKRGNFQVGKEDRQVILDLEKGALGVLLQEMIVVSDPVMCVF